MYDWANSAFATTITAGVLPFYFAGVVVGENGYAIGNKVFSATSLWAWMISFAAFVIFVSAPVFGAISDFSSSKKKFLITFCYMGSISTVLLYFCGSGDVLRTMLIYTVAQIGFVGGNV
ncbi:MAG: MFS transporter, partial [Candidatus Latescibacteria bacterium]|nr:MFS transporter [Candidatus Latescibacterota bacterium]